MGIRRLLLLVCLHCFLRCYSNALMGFVKVWLEDLKEAYTRKFCLRKKISALRPD